MRRSCDVGRRTRPSIVASAGETCGDRVKRRRRGVGYDGATRASPEDLQFILAQCEGLRDRIATAIGHYEAASARAATGAEKESIARKIRALEPKLSHISITVPPAVAAMAPTILLDGRPVVTSSWGKPLRVDEGQHEVVVRFMDDIPYFTRVDAVALKESASWPIPNLPFGAERNEKVTRAAANARSSVCHELHESDHARRSRRRSSGVAHGAHEACWRGSRSVRRSASQGDPESNGACEARLQGELGSHVVDLRLRAVHVSPFLGFEGCACWSRAFLLDGSVPGDAGGRARARRVRAATRRREQGRRSGARRRGGSGDRSMDREDEGQDQSRAQKEEIVVVRPRKAGDTTEAPPNVVPRGATGCACDSRAPREPGSTWGVLLLFLRRPPRRGAARQDTPGVPRRRARPAKAC